MYLSTAPYLSFAGAHLPRLKVPIPLHLLVGRPAAFATFQFLARHAPWTLKEPAHENSFITLARQGQVKHDDLLEKVRVVAAASADCRGRPANRPRGASRHGTIRRLPAALATRHPEQSRGPGRFHQQHGIRAGAVSDRRWIDAAERWR